MIFIVITAIIVYLILITWTWQSLGFIEKNKKIIFVLIGIVIMYVITLIIFHISKSGINYHNTEVQKGIKHILVIIFTGINGMITMPQVARMVDKINEEEIKKEELKKKIIILIIVFILCLIFEIGYMKDTQQGILNIYATMK